MRHPVWIDSDCGFDDMAAIALVNADRKWTIAGLSLCAGNAPLDRVVDHAERMKAFFGWTMPLVAGAAKPLGGPLVTAEYALGVGGLGTMGRALPRPHAPTATTGAAAAIAQAARTAEKPLSILALGPLTNIAIALLAYPELASRLARITWMGGAAMGGNHTATAEFNAAADPEALTVVLESGVPFRMVGLDCCRQVQINLTDVLKLRGLQTERAQTLADLMEAYVRIASPDGRRPMALYDPVAAAALVDERAVTFLPVNISVERNGGLTRGMTVCEFRTHKAAPNAEIARTAMAARIIDLMLAALSSGAMADPALARAS